MKSQSKGQAPWAGREDPQHQGRGCPPEWTQERRRAGRLRLAVGAATHLPLQERCDQAEVLGVLHEPAGGAGRA